MSETKLTTTEIELNGKKYVPKDSVTVKPLSTTEIEWNGDKFTRSDSLPSITQSVDGMPFVLIRSDRSGVHFGYLKTKTEAGDKWNVELVNARRVFYWSGAASLSQLAAEGSSNPNSCKITMEIPSIEVAGVIEIIPIPSTSKLKGVPVWKQ